MLSHLINWYQSIGSQSESVEVEQAKIRVPAVFLLLAIVFFSHYNAATFKEEAITYLLIATYAVLASALLFAVTKNKFKPTYRKIFGAWIDIGGVSAFMALTADVGVMLVGFCLWVIFDNGFRYGEKYLYHAQVLGVVGFFTATNISEYWLNHQTIGFSLLFMLVVLPLYVAKLINRLHEAVHKEGLERQKAAEANSEKARLFANMSHEIRTPLNGILGVSTLLKTTPLNANQQGLLKTLEYSSNLLQSLLNNTLDFTTTDVRKLPIEKAAFAIDDAIHDTIETFKTQGQTKQIQASSCASKSIGRLMGDVTVLQQVLTNLVDNAIKYTEQGSVSLSATIIQDEKTKSTIRFEVIDTDIEMPADKQHKVFEDFTQASASTTHQFDASGLDLTIAKNMVEAMGGELKFQSTEGVGMRFWFDLDLEKASSIESLNTLPETFETNLTSTSSQEPLNILICEDEATNQKIITRLLTLPGHHVSVVDDSEEMLDTLESQGFDLVITDLNMAGMNGIDALKLYRFMHPTDIHTRFILYTADIAEETKSEAKNAGFDDILTKPIDATTLFYTVEKTLNLAPNTARYWLNNIKNTNQAVEVNANLTTDNRTLDINTLLELEKIGAGDDLFMHRLLKNFLADSVKMINQINTAINQKNIGELQGYCYALKGNCLSIGATQLASTTERLRKLSGTTSTTQSLEILNQLNKDFSQLTLAVENHLRRPKVASK